MTDQEVIKLLEDNINKKLKKSGSKLPFHLDELSYMKELDRPYFNLYTINDFNIYIDVDGNCYQIEYKDKVYRDFKELKSAVD